MKDTIYIHLPAYREPELIPTIKDAIANAKYPKRLRFGICRQYNPEDKFDNIDEFRKDKRFKIDEMIYTEAKGLPYARYRINEMITDETYILQLDSHHRFIKNWDEELISMHKGLEKKVAKPILAGYLPYYDPFDDPAKRTMEPWQQQFVCFYPHGTIFIRPGGIPNWQELTEPFPSRFLSGHFCFARTEWAKEIKHDTDIYFSGEEINLTVRSFTSGYDFFHPHKLVIWHATMREERSGKLVWDDQSKRGENWCKAQDDARAKIRQLFRTEDNGYDLTGYDLGTVRTLHDYEKYAGVDFARRSVQQYTLDNKFPPNPPVPEEEWAEHLQKSFYHLVTIYRTDFPKNDYEHILVAFDDVNGISLNSKFISGQQLKEFMETGNNIHYEEYFLSVKRPARVVFWGMSTEHGWCDRKEYAYS
jgi:Glycosyltransferase (GlcNAc)